MRTHNKSGAVCVCAEIQLCESVGPEHFGGMPMERFAEIIGIEE